MAFVCHRRATSGADDREHSAPDTVRGRDSRPWVHAPRGGDCWAHHIATRYSSESWWGRSERIATDAGAVAIRCGALSAIALRSLGTGLSISRYSKRRPSREATTRTPAAAAHARSMPQRLLERRRIVRSVGRMW
jgi:hypothetical protein